MTSASNMIVEESNESLENNEPLYCAQCDKVALDHVCDANCPHDCIKSKCRTHLNDLNAEGECVFLCGVCESPLYGVECVKDVVVNVRPTVLVLAGNAPSAIARFGNVSCLVGEIITTFAQAECNLWALFPPGTLGKNPRWDSDLAKFSKWVKQGKISGELHGISYESAATSLCELDKKVRWVRNTLAHGRIAFQSEEKWVFSANRSEKTPGRSWISLVNGEHEVELTHEFLAPIVVNVQELLRVVNQIQELTGWLNAQKKRDVLDES